MEELDRLVADTVPMVVQPVPTKLLVVEVQPKEELKLVVVALVVLVVRELDSSFNCIH